MYRLRPLLTHATLLAALALPSAAPSADPEPGAQSAFDPVVEGTSAQMLAGRTAVIATRDAPPFAMRTDAGWEGITVELLGRIREETGLDFELREMSLTEMLEATASGQVDAAAAALTITRERERAMDFTHPFHSAGLGVAVPERPAVGWFSTVASLVSLPFLQSMGALLGVLALVGALMWLAERRRNDQFQRDPIQGVGSGLWWSAVTMTTVGYGDKAPVTLVGRLIGLVWMFASIILISSFTAAIASSLTIGQLDQAISGVDDLRGKRVLSLPGSTSAAYLDEKLIRFEAAGGLREALERVAAGKADAVVHDAPILYHLVSSEFPARLRVLPAVFARQDYGIALPPGSPLREPLSRAILEVIRTPAWEDLVKSYLGN